MAKAEFNDRCLDHDERTLDRDEQTCDGDENLKNLDHDKEIFESSESEIVGLETTENDEQKGNEDDGAVALRWGNGSGAAQMLFDENADDVVEYFGDPRKVNHFGDFFG